MVEGDAALYREDSSKYLLERHPFARSSWSSVQVGASPSVMFGEDLPWYAEGISNQHFRVVNDKQRRQNDSTGVRISTAG